MKKYLSVMKLQFKYFFKCYTLSGLYILILAVIGIGLGYPVLRGYNSFRTVYLISRFQFYYLVLHTVIIFLMLRKSEEYSVEEAMQGTCGGSSVYRKSMIMVQLICLLFVQILFLVFIITANIMNDDNNYIYTILFKTLLYNTILPVLVCLAIAALCSKLKSRITSLGFLAMFFIMISPVTNVDWYNKPSFPFDQIWKTIRWPFAFLFDNKDWAPDVQYGLQTELPRLFLLLFWLLFTAGILIFMSGNRKKYKISRKYLGGFSLAFAVILLVNSYGSASMYRIDDNWNGYNRDMNRKQEKLTLADFDETNYQITDYSMDITLAKELEVEALLHLEFQKTANEFELTLYDGYEIKSINKIENNLKKEIKYFRDKENIFIKSDNPVTEMDIYIKYSGHSNRFYSNSEGTMLPGYFPWYPMAGHKKIFLDTHSTTSGYGYNPYNRIKNAEIKARIHTNKSIVTNLKEIRKGYYGGKADSFSLFTGNIQKSEDSLLTTSLPLSYDKDFTWEEQQKQLKKNIEEAYSQMKNLFGEDISEWKNKPVISVSRDLSRNVFNSNMTLYDDYILVSEGRFLADDIVLYNIAKNCRETLLVRTFALSIGYDNASEIVQTMLERLNFSEDGEAPGREEVELKKEIIKCCDIVGEKEFIKCVYQYAATREKVGSDLEFLQKLEEDGKDAH